MAPPGEGPAGDRQPWKTRGYSGTSRTGSTFSSLVALVSDQNVTG